MGSITSGRTGSTTTGGVSGRSAGVGKATDRPMAFCRISNTSTVNGLPEDSTSANSLPVEIPNGSTILPAFNCSGKRCGSPKLTNAVSTLRRSTRACPPLLVWNDTSLPSTYSSNTLAVAQGLTCTSNSNSAALRPMADCEAPSKPFVRLAVKSMAPLSETDSLIFEPSVDTESRMIERTASSCATLPNSSSFTRCSMRWPHSGATGAGLLPSRVASR